LRSPTTSIAGSPGLSLGDVVIAPSAAVVRARPPAGSAGS
jgi:hypothetical protein